MLGFVNGLAIVIFLAQLSQFHVPGAEHVAKPGSHGPSLFDAPYMTGAPLFMMLGLVALTMFLIWAENYSALLNYPCGHWTY